MGQHPTLRSLNSIIQYWGPVAEGEALAAQVHWLTFGTRRNMRHAALAVVVQWIILFVGLLINIDSGDCAIRGDYKTVNYRGWWSIFIHGQAPGAGGGPGQCVTLCLTPGVAGGWGPGWGDRGGPTPGGRPTPAWSPLRGRGSTLWILSTWRLF